MAKQPKLKVNLGTPERQEACLETLQMCVRITRDLIGEVQRIEGPIAMEALARTFEKIVADVILASTTPPNA